MCPHDLMHDGNAPFHITMVECRFSRSTLVSIHPSVESCQHLCRGKMRFSTAMGREAAAPELLSALYASFRILLACKHIQSPVEPRVHCAARCRHEQSHH